MSAIAATREDQIREAVIRELPTAIDDINLDPLVCHSIGKTRKVYRRKGGAELLIFGTDRISAYDQPFGTIPYKGTVLTRVASWAFEALIRNKVPTHYIGMPDPNVLHVRRTVPRLIEVVVRGYLAGSLLREYEEGRRNTYGLELPDGLRPYQQLKEPIVTPTTKARVGHDQPLTEEQIYAEHLATPREYAEMKELALIAYQIGCEEAKKVGLIEADTKYEFGADHQGQIILIDEANTPDSSRYWESSSYEERFAAGQPPVELDKEFFRRFLREEYGYMGEGPVPNVPDEIRVQTGMIYVSICDRLTGKELALSDREHTIRRIMSNLGAAGFMTA